MNARQHAGGRVPIAALTDAAGGRVQPAVIKHALSLEPQGWQEAFRSCACPVDGDGKVAGYSYIASESGAVGVDLVSSRIPREAVISAIGDPFP